MKYDICYDMRIQLNNMVSYLSKIKSPPNFLPFFTWASSYRLWRASALSSASWARSLCSLRTCQSLNCSLRGNQQLKCTHGTREGWTHGEGHAYGVLAACSINNNNAKKSIHCHAYLTAYAPTPKAATESTALLAMLCYICSSDIYDNILTKIFLMIGTKINDVCNHTNKPMYNMSGMNKPNDPLNDF